MTPKKSFGPTAFAAPVRRLAKLAASSRLPRHRTWTKGQTIDSAMAQNNNRAGLHVGSRIARVDHADPLLEQWICRYQQKQENAAEKYGDEPHGKPALQCRQIEGADGIAEKSERAGQIEIAQCRGALAEPRRS